MAWLVGQLPNSDSTVRVASYAVLPDAGYTFARIRTDTSLPFVEDDSLRPARATRYWLRIRVVNTAHYDALCILTVQPAVHTTLYYFDANSGRWLSYQSGIDVPYTGRRNRADGAMVAEGRAETVVYVNTDVHLLRQVSNALKPQIRLEKYAQVNREEQFIRITWVAALSVLGLFFLNNLIIYANFRDKIVRYYLLAQVGGIVYITNVKQFFYILLPSRVFSVSTYPDGSIHYFDVCDLFQHVSIALILYGLVQLTRVYLQTSGTLPRIDTFLKYGLYAYLLLTAAVLTANTAGISPDYYTVHDQNIHALLLMGGILYASVVGYRRNLSAAAPFLLANSLPLVFMSMIPLFHLFFSQYTTPEALMPDLAVVSQALAFSIALVARTKYMQTELAARTGMTQKLEFDMREIELRHQLAELENQTMMADIWHEKTRNELLQERLDVNQRELASTTMYIVQKNELLASLRAQLTRLNKQNPPGWHQELKGIESILRSNLYLDADWGKFRVHFEQVHPNFFEDLRARHPSLTKYEIRLYAYFHINLSTKEIAALLNIDPASVRRAKTRLYKKMALPVSGNPPDRTD